ncbi:uncharacterized protein LOC111309443 [Durio zibethinus]|uniref:Uncharacterized protein LOC111309443 n=1 Tax=Durio zibethinus TaxID=66656 RepID=A0A6P6AH76_DURZI|nr:uncharacterized protein LOC111309443 [Durio zibethinus]
MFTCWTSVTIYGHLISGKIFGYYYMIMCLAEALGFAQKGILDNEQPNRTRISKSYSVSFIIINTLDLAFHTISNLWFFHCLDSSAFCSVFFPASVLMAAAKSCPLPSYTPQEVAAVFVDRYYFLLRDSPGELHKFYLDSSMVSRLGPDGAMISFTTMEEIRKHVLSSLDCKEYEILSSDAQLTANEGVFVVVIGCFTTKNNQMRNFNQSFLLTPMERANSYFVLNDIMRFLDEQETKVVHSEDVLTAVSTSTSDDEPTNDVPKKSFLSVVHALKENTAPFKAPPVRKSISRAPQESNFDEKSGSEEKKNTRTVDNVEGTSIFVGNLATDSKPEELYEAFKSFGPIKRNGVQIRTDKQHRWYAFIQFESFCSAQSAIQASFIRIGDRRLNIKEKKRNDSGNSKFSRDSLNGNGNGNGNGHDNFRNFTWRNGPAN